MHCRLTKSVSSLQRRRGISRTIVVPSFRSLLLLLMASCWVVTTNRIEKALFVSGFSVNKNKNALPPPILPENSETMIQEASLAIRSAMKDGSINYQTIRLPLSNQGRILCRQLGHWVAGRSTRNLSISMTNRSATAKGRGDFE